MAARREFLRKQDERIAGYSPAILFEKLEQRILLSSDSLLISAEALVDNLESVPAEVSEISLDITPAEALAEWQALFPGQDYVVWEKDAPWDHLAQVTGPPDGVTELQTISLDIGRNEYESASFVVTNINAATITFDLNYDLTDLSITLRKGVWATARDGVKVNDALSLIDGGQVTIDSGESLEIWITLNGNDVAAGLYNPTINILPQGFDPGSVDISVTVHDVSLPDVLPLNTFYWDYVVPGWATPEENDEKLADLKSHYVNTATIHPWILPRYGFDNGTGELIADYTVFDEAIDMYEAGLEPQTYLFEMLCDIYFEPTWLVEYPSASRPEFLSPAWKAGFQQWLTGWVAHMQSRGMGYDDYMLHPYDERLDDSVYQVAKLIKQTDPQVRVYANSMGTEEGEINTIAPYVDVWCPYMNFLHDVGRSTGGMTQTVSLSPNTEYTFSFYGKNGSNMNYWDMNFNGSTPRHADILEATNWTQASHTFTTASNTTGVEFRFFPTIGNGNILIDDVFLGSDPEINLVVNGDMELGDPPTGWSPYIATITANTVDTHWGNQSAKVTSNLEGNNTGVDALRELIFGDPPEPEPVKNLSPNGDMETGDPPTGWSAQNSTVSASSDTPDGSSQSLNVVALDGIDGYAWAGTHAGDYADQDLTISFDYKGTGYVRIYDSVSWAAIFADVVSSTEWAYYELTFATSSTLADLYVEAYDNDKTDGTGPLYDNLYLSITQDPPPPNPSYSYWTYAGPPTGVDATKADPYRDYRTGPWDAWNESMTGFGYWIYSYRDFWDYSAPGAPAEGGYAVVYNTTRPDTPPEVSSQELIVPGKRWEATREGVEDYAYIHMLQTLIDEAPLPPDSSLILDAEDTLAYWVEMVLDNPGVELASQAKVEIIEAILALTPNLLPGDANGDGMVSAGDYASVQANFGNIGAAYYLPGDANADGMVSAGDYASVQANFGNTSASAAAIPIDTTPSKSAPVTEPVTISVNEPVSDSLPALKASKYKEIKPVVGFMREAEYRPLKLRSSKASLTSLFIKSKAYLPESIALSPKLSRLHLGQKLENSKLVVFSSPLAESFVSPQLALLSNNILDRWELLSL